MKHAITIAGLVIEVELWPSFIPQQGPIQDWIKMDCSVKTPYSECHLEALLLPLKEWITFRSRLKELIARNFYKGISINSLMPSFDIIVTSLISERFLLEVQLSPDVRLERHMYNFEVSRTEIEQFMKLVEYSILSFPNERLC